MSSEFLEALRFSIGRSSSQEQVSYQFYSCSNELHCTKIRTNCTALYYCNLYCLKSSTVYDKLRLYKVYSVPEVVSDAYSSQSHLKKNRDGDYKLIWVL